MNIQRYALPMIVAAGFHSALFFLTPDRTMAVEKPPLHKDPPLPSLPDDAIAMEDPADRPDDSDGAVGGSLAPDIPEVTVDSLEKPTFVVTKTENIHPEVTTTVIPTKFGPGGPEGPGVTGIPRFESLAHLDRHPRATAQVPPDYPLSLHQRGVSGSVTVEFDVDTMGHVIRAEVVNYTHREFAEPALRAVRNWRFEPGKRNGKVVPFRMAVPIQFSIES